MTTTQTEAQPADGQEDTAGTADTSETASDAQEPQDDRQDGQDGGTGGNEAARYRRRLRETETERDAVAERLAGYQRREAERLAAESLSRPDDLWLAGADVSAVLDDGGMVDTAKVAAVVAAVLDGRPQLARRQPVRPNPQQGTTGGGGPASTSWQQVLSNR